MVVGERKTKRMANNYAKNEMRPFAEAFLNEANAILNETGIDIYSNPSRAMFSNAANESMKNFFIEQSYDPNGMTAEEINEHVTDMEALYENDREAVLEHVSGADMNPIIGMTFPLHKFILMNMVFDKGAIPKVIAQSPKFTIGMEYRVLVDTEGNELDMFYQQNQMTDAIEATAPAITFDVTLPMLDTEEIVHEKLGGLAGVDHLHIDTRVSAVKVSKVYFEEGDILPDPETGYVEIGGELATADTAGEYDVWVRVNAPFNPAYGEIERALMQPVSYRYKQMNAETGEVEIAEVKGILSGSMNRDRLNITDLKGVFSEVRVTSRLDTSNARQTTCSVKWREKTDIVEIGPAIPINTTISPEEVKDIAALYNVNQVTKIMSLYKTVLGNYKDDKIKRSLDESFKTMDSRSKLYGSFDYAPRESYTGDHIAWRRATFFDYFDTQITRLLQVLNDPNVVVTVFGAPDIVRKITPVEYTYQSPASIGPVDIDYKKTVCTSDKRVYQFIGSDKLRDTTELIVILCPHGSDRIIYRIYDYQMYLSNEIRNADNPSLPAIHAFERFKFVEYQAVQGRINILHPSGIKEESYDRIRIQVVD